MSNTKGNAYPLWMISNSFQVQSVDSSQHITNQSDEGFAMDFGISEDGTIWVLSTQPDPDGGGSKIYWGNGDSNWNEIATSDPGGIRICGFTGSSCLFLTGDYQLMSMDTDGTSKTIYDGSTNPVIEFDYGDNTIWAVLSNKEGEIPTLHYTDASTINWTSVGENLYSLYSLSVNVQGFCFGIMDYKPVYYEKNGTTGSAGATGSKLALAISNKEASFILTNDGDASGNLVMEYTPDGGGTFFSHKSTGDAYFIDLL